MPLLACKSWRMTQAVECPRCGQGSVLGYAVRVTGEHVWICDECEALWSSPDVAAPFEQFSAFMGARGGVGLWDEIVETS